jgi:hypothetical protein
VGRIEVNTEFWWGYLRERTHLKGLRVDEEIILNLILQEFIVKVWTRFVLVQICKNCKILLKLMKFGFPKMERLFG